MADVLTHDRRAEMAERVLAEVEAAFDVDFLNHARMARGMAPMTLDERRALERQHVEAHLASMARARAGGAPGGG